MEKPSIIYVRFFLVPWKVYSLEVLRQKEPGRSLVVHCFGKTVCSSFKGICLERSWLLVFERLNTWFRFVIRKPSCLVNVYAAFLWKTLKVQGYQNKGKQERPGGTWGNSWFLLVMESVLAIKDEVFALQPFCSPSTLHSEKKSTSEHLFWCFRLSQIEVSIEYQEGPNSTWKDHDRNLGVQMDYLVLPGTE